MSHHLRAVGRGPGGLVAAAVAVALLAGTGPAHAGLGPAASSPAGIRIADAHASADTPSAPTLTIADGSWLEGTVTVSSDATREGDPVTALTVDGTPLTAAPTSGVSRLTFTMGGNGTEARYHNYVEVNGVAQQRVEFGDIAGGESGELLIPNEWLVQGENVLRVVPGTIPCSYTGGGDAVPSVNFDDFPIDELTLTLLGEVADGEENPFTHNFGDGSTCVAPGVVAEPFDYRFHVAGVPGATTGLSAELDTRTLDNGSHTIAATTADGASATRTVRVNNAPTGAPAVNVADGSLLNKTVPVIATSPAGGAPLSALTVDGEQPPAAEVLAPGTARLGFTVGTNSIEARYANHLLVNGRRVDLGGDWVSSAVEIAFPNHYLRPGDNEITVVTGDISSGSGATLCANHDDFELSLLSLAPATGTATQTETVTSTGTVRVKPGVTPTTYQLGDGTCGEPATSTNDLTFHFTVADAETTRSLATLGSGVAGLGFAIGGNGADNGFDNTLVINGNVMELGLWETSQNPARLDFPNEWLLPGVNVVDIVAGSDHGSATGGCDNYDDFTITDFALLPQDGSAVQLTKMTNVSNASVPVNIGDATCGSSYTPSLRWTILFEVDAEEGGLRADLDTTALSDGEHVIAAVAGSGEDRKTATRTIDVDNTAPRLARSVPDQGQRLTASVALDVAVSDAHDVVGEPVITLDGTPIAPGDPVGPGLTPGEHRIAVQARDSLGNTATRTVTFTSAGIPDAPAALAPADGAAGLGGSAQLSARLTTPGGGDVKATFSRADVVAPSSGFQGTATALPVTLEVAGESAVDAASLERLAPGDGADLASPAGREISFQRFDLEVGDPDTAPVLRWDGVVDPQRTVALRAWNTAERRWDVLASSRGAAEGDTVLVARVTPAYRDQGTVHVLVTGEDPFADDIDPGDPVQQAFDDPSSYDFSIVHFTDTQYLSEGAAGGTYQDFDGVTEDADAMTLEEREVWRKAYRNITQWVATNAGKRKIAYTAHTGDIIENDYYDPIARGVVNPDTGKNELDEQVSAEFEISSRFQQVLDSAGVVNQVIAGNHDNQLGTEEGPGSRFNQWYGPQRYQEASLDWGLDADYHPWKPGDNQNNYVLFSAGGLEFVAVGLSYGVTNEEAAWADSVFRQFPNRNGILLSHDYLKPSTNPDGRGAAFSAPDGSMLYRKVVESNPNVFLILAGHEHGVGTNLKRGVGAEVQHDVVELLADYQFYTVDAHTLGLDKDLDGDGEAEHASGDRLQFGASFLRLLQFDVERGEMSVDTYSPFLGEFGATEWDIRNGTTPRYNGDEDNMVLPVDLTSRTTSFSTDSIVAFSPREVIGQQTVASGATAQVTWRGLAPHTTYGWVVTAATAGGGVTAADPAVFRTGAVESRLEVGNVSTSYRTPAVVRVAVTGLENPTGTVTIRHGERELGSAELSGGSATIALPADFRPGAYPLTAEYDGTEALQGAERDFVLTVTEIAAPPLVQHPTTVTATPSAKRVKRGAPFRLRVRLGSSAGVPTGRVVIMHKGRRVGVATVVDGRAVVRIKAPRKLGAARYVVRYLGNTTMLPSGATAKVKVVKKPPRRR